MYKLLMIFLYLLMIFLLFRASGATKGGSGAQNPDRPTDSVGILGLSTSVRICVVGI